MTAHIFDIKSKIEQRLSANFSAVPILYQNLTLEQIKDASGAMPDSFVLVETQIFSNDQIGLGGVGDRLFRSEGFIYFHIFTPVGSGEGLNDEYADDIAVIFRGVEFDGVVCYGVSPFGEAGKGDDEGRYWRTSLQCRFHYDQTF